MAANPNFFIGYASIEELLDRRDRSATQLYLFPCTQVEQSSRYGNLNFRRYHLIVSLVHEGAIHYCRVPYGGIQVINDHNGEPVGDCQRGIDRIHSRGQTLMDCVRAYISRQGFALPRQAAPSFPRDLILMEGGQEFARLNDDKTAYVAVGEEAAS